MLSFHSVQFDEGFRKQLRTPRRFCGIFSCLSPCLHRICIDAFILQCSPNVGNSLIESFILDIDVVDLALQIEIPSASDESE